MCACRCECYVQGFFRMDFAVNIIGKSHYNMWASVCLHTAIARPSLKTSPRVPFQFVATVYQRVSHLFLLLTEALSTLRYFPERLYTHSLYIAQECVVLRQSR